MKQFMKWILRFFNYELQETPSVEEAIAEYENRGWVPRVVCHPFISAPRRKFQSSTVMPLHLYNEVHSDNYDSDTEQQ